MFRQTWTDLFRSHSPALCVKYPKCMASFLAVIPFISTVVSFHMYYLKNKNKIKMLLLYSFMPF